MFRIIKHSFSFSKAVLSSHVIKCIQTLWNISSGSYFICNVIYEAIQSVRRYCSVLLNRWKGKHAESCSRSLHCKPLQSFPNLRKSTFLSVNKWILIKKRILNHLNGLIFTRMAEYVICKRLVMRNYYSTGKKNGSINSNFKDWGVKSMCVFNPLIGSNDNWSAYDIRLKVCCSILLYKIQDLINESTELGLACSNFEKEKACREEGPICNRCIIRIMGGCKSCQNLKVYGNESERRKYFECTTERPNIPTSYFQHGIMNGNFVYFILC